MGGLKTNISFHKSLLPHHTVRLNSLCISETSMTHFKAALMYISMRAKKLHYYPSSFITHKNLSTTPFITCNTCYSFSCLHVYENKLSFNKHDYVLVRTMTNILGHCMRAQVHRPNNLQYDSIFNPLDCENP